MDFEFTYDEYDRPVAEFSMGHEVIGRWISEDLGQNHSRLEELLEVTDQLIQQRIMQREFTSAHFRVVLSTESAEVSLTEDDSDEDIPEDMEYYDDESSASCGLEDFRDALIAWQEFIGG